MTKSIIAGLMDQLTILQAIDSNDEQVQANTASISTLQSALPAYVYKAVINQSSGGAPSVVSTLVNTFPSATFSYIVAGDFLLELGIDLDGYNVNTIQDCVSDTGTLGGLLGYVYAQAAGGDNIQIQTANSALAAADDILVNYTLVIEAYPA